MTLMASSAAALASPSPLTAAQPPKPSVPHSIEGGGDSDEEMEYEEIEVEEEVEVEVGDEDEEEVEEAEGGGNGSGVGGDLAPVREENEEKGDRTSINNEPKASPDNSRKVNALETPAVRDIAAGSRTPNASEETRNVPIETSVVQDVAATLGTTDVPRFFSSPRVRLRESSSIPDIDGTSKKLKIICEFHAKGWCIKGSSCRFLHIRNGSGAAARASDVLDWEVPPSSGACIPSQQSGEKPNLDSEASRFVDRQKDGLGSTSLQITAESSGPNLYSNSHIYYTAPPSIYGGYFSNLSAVPNGNFNMNISSVGMPEGITVRKSNLMHPNDDGFGWSSYSHSWRASSSWNNHAGASSNFLEPSLKPHATASSSKPNNPPVSGYEAENISRNYHATEAKPRMDETKVSSDDWEPSTPFRPSHPITRNLLSKVSLYDPIRDCVEPNPVKEGQVKLSSSDQGSTVRNVRPLSHNSQEEVKNLSSSHVGDAAKHNFCDSPKADDQRHGSNSYPKVGESGKTNGMAVGTCREEQSQSKAFKSFHTTLIEYVKDLVKPTWRQGLLTKDAHKVVVKKSVDKVLCSIQDDQFPSTPESVKLYLSSSHEKLVKLVEAHIERYGKH